jgi:hypothetical protein
LVHDGIAGECRLHDKSDADSDNSRNCGDNYKAKWAFLHVFPSQIGDKSTKDCWYADGTAMQSVS